MRVSLTVPLPPTTNHLFYNSKEGGRRKSGKYKQWLQGCRTEVLVQQAKCLPDKRPLRIGIGVELDRDKGGDVDNRIKAILDMLQDSGVIENDKWADDVRIVRYPPSDNPRVRVIISTIEG